MQRILFINEQTIKDNSIIQTNVDSKIIVNTIYEVQDLELQPTLGLSIYTGLTQEVISASTLGSGYTFTATGQTLLQEYIQPFLIYGTLVYGFTPLHFKVTNKGINKKNDDNSVNASAQELESLKAHYTSKFDIYKERLIKYLTITLQEPVPAIVDSTSSSTGWYLPDFEVNLEDYFEALANKTTYYAGYFGGYYRRY